MGFKENLLKKIEIDGITAEVSRSMRFTKGSDGPPRINLQAMKQLLDMAPYTYSKERDLDLYIQDQDQGKPDILVLDNELKVYHTDVADVALRKSPTVKEMVSIRNAIKILNDKDVVVSAKADTLQRVHDQLIDGLDLAFTPADIEAIADDGVQSLKNSYAEGVVESLTLLGELLGWQPAPKPFQFAHYYVSGAVERKSSMETVMGPMVLYGRMHNTLQLLRSPVSTQDRTAMERVEQITTNEARPDCEGADVFNAIKEMVLKQK